MVCLAVIGMMLSACASSRESTPTSPPHQTYSYGKFSTVDPSKDFHPGDELTLEWEALPEKTVSAAAPDQITLLAGLYGPFDSVDQLKEVMSFNGAPKPPPAKDLSDAAVGANPIETNSWSNETYTSTLALPSTLQPGYYSLVRASVTNTSQGSTRSEAQTVLHVSLR